MKKKEELLQELVGDLESEFGETKQYATADDWRKKAYLEMRIEAGEATKEEKEELERLRSFPSSPELFERIRADEERHRQLVRK